MRAEVTQRSGVFGAENRAGRKLQAADDPRNVEGAAFRCNVLSTNVIGL